MSYLQLVILTCDPDHINCLFLVIQFPQQSSRINLRRIGLYAITLRFLQSNYPQVGIVSDGGASKVGLVFQNHHIKSFPTVNVHGIKYGAITNNRGQRCCHAYVHGRMAAQIAYIISVSIPHENSSTINLDIAIIRWFQTVPDPPIMPWSLL